MFERRPTTQEKILDDIMVTVDNTQIFLNDALKRIWEKLLEMEIKQDKKLEVNDEQKDESKKKGNR